MGRVVATWPLNRRYRLRIDYKLGEFPQIYALEPDLVGLAAEYTAGRRLPHVYCEDPVRLCVFHPSKREWYDSDSLAGTVVPWSISWLTFFEDWLSTDVWSGGGEHPARSSIARAED